MAAKAICVLTGDVKGVVEFNQAVSNVAGGLEVAPEFD